MPKRNSPNDIKNLDDLNDLQNIVVDKRNLKRKTEKRNRRDRHYNKLFIKIAFTSQQRLPAGTLRFGFLKSEVYYAKVRQGPRHCCEINANQGQCTFTSNRHFFSSNKIL